MLEILHQLAPHLELLGEELWQCTLQTIQMVVVAGSVSFLLGIIFGVILIVTRPQGILEKAWLYTLLDKAINIIRSIPFLILLVLLIPLSRMIVGTAIGVKGTYIPLIIGTTPFFARQIETAISQVDPGYIEASIALGFSPLDIIFKVYLRESIPSITRGTMITLINLIGLTAMAGVTGGGGLGDFAIRYGYQLNYTDMIVCSIVIILIMVSIIQIIGNLIIKKTTH